MLHKIISQSTGGINYENQPTITFGGADTGNYNSLTTTDVNLFTPTTTNVNTYNHIPHIIEYYGDLHVMYVTSKANEENPGQYVRYQKSTDNGATWSSPVTLLASQDDPDKDYTTTDGRVCIAAAWAVYNSELYAIVDINDREGAVSNRARYKVGVLAIKVSSGAVFDTPVWIENGDGTLSAPDPIPTYTAYLFDNTLRSNLRQYLTIPENRPTWYYSVLDTDILYSRSDYLTAHVTEPQVATLLNGQVLRIWRSAVSGATDYKVADTSENNGASWNSKYITNIPDNPSRTNFVKLGNTYAVIGNNQNANRTPLYIAFSPDGLNYKSGNTYDVAVSTDSASFSGSGKGIGCQYPDTIQLANGKIICVYSITKEKIECSIFDKPTLI